MNTVFFKFLSFNLLAGHIFIDKTHIKKNPLGSSALDKYYCQSTITELPRELPPPRCSPVKGLAEHSKGGIFRLHWCPRPAVCRLLDQSWFIASSERAKLQKHFQQFYTATNQAHDQWVCILQVFGFWCFFFLPFCQLFI